MFKYCTVCTAVAHQHPKCEVGNPSNCQQEITDNNNNLTGFSNLLYQHLLHLENLGLQQFISSTNLTINFQITQLFSLEDVRKNGKYTDYYIYSDATQKRQRSLQRLTLSIFQSTNNLSIDKFVSFKIIYQTKILCLHYFQLLKCEDLLLYLCYHYMTVFDCLSDETSYPQISPWTLENL